MNSGMARSNFSSMHACFLSLKTFGDWKNLSILTLVWIVMIILVNPIGDFPLNDDWAYAIGVRSVLEQGSFQIPGFSSANVGPQIYWGALFCLPFGFSFTALRFSSLTLGLLGGWAAYGLFAEVWKNREVALIAALVLLVNPVYFGLANTFMTDVPFLALVITSMFLIVRGMRREEPMFVVAGMLVCILATLLRQLALVVLLGYAMAHLVRRGLGWRNIVVAIMPLLFGLTVHLAFSRWLAESGRKPRSGTIGDISIYAVVKYVLPISVQEIVYALLQTGLLVLPLIVVCLSFSRLQTAKVGKRNVIVPLALVVLVLGAFLLVRHETMPRNQNVLTYFGMGPLTLRDSFILKSNLPAMTPGLSIFWKAITGISILGASFVVLAFAVGMRRAVIRMRNERAGMSAVWQPVFFTTIAISYFGIFVLVSTSNAFFDRYMLPLFVIFSLALPVLGEVSTETTRRWSMGQAIAVSMLIAFASFSILATRDYLEWNRARWVALRDLTDVQKIDAHRIDGGYEFNGWINYDPLYKAHDNKSWWWVDDDEYMLASGPVPGYREIRRLPFRRWLTNTQSDVVVLRRIGS